MRTTRGLQSLFVLALLTASSAAQATSFEDQKLTASDGEFLDGLGRAVSIHAGTALVTANADDDQGSARIYRRSGGQWVEETVITAFDGAPGDQFGFTAALFGGVAVIGADGDDDKGSGSGSVYVYRFDGASWVFEQKLSVSDGESGDGFGRSVDYTGGVIAVGAPNDDDQGSNAGAAYVFRWNGASWVQEAKLVAATPGAQDNLGWSVATHGDAVVATAITDDELGSDSGSAYVFRRVGGVWQEEQRLLASDGGAGDWFGWSVAIDGDAIAVGANHHGHPAQNAGAAYVFRRVGGVWTEEQELQPAGLGAFDTLGWSVDIQGDHVLAGAGGYPAGSGGGAVYVFNHDGAGWVESHQWLASDGPGSGFFLDNLGLSVAMDGPLALVGAGWAPGVSAQDAGAAYAYDLTPLALDAVPDISGPGQVLELRTYGGLAGGPMGILVTDIGGTPQLLIAFTNVFDAAGKHSFFPVVPPSLVGTTGTFLAGGFWQPGVLGFSNPVTVSFL